MRQIVMNNKLEIPQIGVGTWTLRGETARQNVRLALEAGFRHIDTAQGYDNHHQGGHRYHTWRQCRSCSGGLFSGD